VRISTEASDNLTGLTEPLFAREENAMRVRSTLFALPAFVIVMVVCGCTPEGTYNIPADPAKEAAEIGPGAPARKAGVGRRKVTKPPGGGPLKDANNLRPSQ
jgi:hypothetical protein